MAGRTKRTILIDPDEVAVVGFDWSNWLASIGASALDQSVFAAATSSVVVGTGAIEVEKGGITVTPPAPTISVDHITAAHIWVAEGGRLGDEVVVTNTVRVGSRVKQQHHRLVVSDENE